MTDPTRFQIRRAVPSVALWPGDKVVRQPDGTLELRRQLPRNAIVALGEAVRRGDAEPEQAA